jgi:hypothetical protein
MELNAISRRHELKPLNLKRICDWVVTRMLKNRRDEGTITEQSNQRRNLVSQIGITIIDQE